MLIFVPSDRLTKCPRTREDECDILRSGGRGRWGHHPRQPTTTFRSLGLGEFSSPWQWSKSETLLLPERLKSSGGIGMSVEFILGGGCCHWGSGPATNRVWSRGPASITACKSFPFSGNGFLVFSSSSLSFSVGEERKEEEEDDDDDGGSCMEGSSSRGFEVLDGLSETSNWHFWRASSFSFKAMLRRFLRWMSSNSRDSISSFVDSIIFSSSTVVYRSACSSSSMPCKSGNRTDEPSSHSKLQSNMLPHSETDKFFCFPTA